MRVIEHEVMYVKQALEWYIISLEDVASSGEVESIEDLPAYKHKTVDDIVREYLEVAR